MRDLSLEILSREPETELVLQTLRAITGGKAAAELSLAWGWNSKRS